MRTRMVPFQRHVQRLTRLVRQAAPRPASRPSSRSRAPRASWTGRCSSACCRRSSTCCATRWCTASRRRRARRRRQARDRPHHDGLHREGAEVVIVVERRRRRHRRRRDPQQGASSMGLLRARPGADRRGSDAADPRAGLHHRRAPHPARGPRRRHGRGRHRDQEARRRAVHRVHAGPGRALHDPPAVHARHQPGADRARDDELYALPLPTVEGVARLPRAEVEQHLAEERRPSITAGSATASSTWRVRRQRAVAAAGDGRAAARDPGARRRALDRRWSPTS